MPCWPSTPTEPRRSRSSTGWNRSGRLRRTASSPGGERRTRLPFSRRTLFYGAGESRRIETTAMAVLALWQAGRSPESVRRALAWLVAQKDGQGTWGSTQATVLALEALLAGTGKPLGGDKPRRIAILLDGETRPGAGDLRRPGRRPAAGRSLGPHRHGAGDSSADDRGPLAAPIPAIRSSSATTSPTRSTARTRRPTRGP